MYAAVSLTLGVAAIAWYLEMSALWFSSVGVSIAVATVVNVRDLYTQKRLRDSLNAMIKTECCCTDKCQDPKSVIICTCVLRALCGILAIFAVVISWFERSAFLQGQYTVTSVSWGVVSSAWLISCIPLFISLVQCAAHLAEAKSDGKLEKVLWFRKAVSLWFVHDVVLGIFWLYMATMLYDLADDEDDEEWRTIFLSMVSWHIVILVVHAFAFIDAHQTPLKNTACCASERKPFWWKTLHILALVATYSALITRMRHGDLKTMGSTLPQVSIFVFCTMVVGITKDMQSDTAVQTAQPPRKNQRKMIRLESGLNF